MSSNPILSVIVLSYNNAQYIEDCLSSLTRQGIDSYEVLVIDDSSPDNSADVIREFIKDKPQFSLIEKPNSGGAISADLGISKAKGKYCALVDSDDIVADNAYKKLISRIEKDDSDFASGLPLRMVNGFMHAFLSSGNESNVFAFDRVLETDEDRAFFTNQVFYWNSVYKTDFLRDNNIEMPANLMIADRIFVYKAAMCAKKISIISDVVYYWRKKENEDNTSITDQTAEFHMIADRCDSFQAQIKLCLTEYERHPQFVKAMWEHSFSRMYYPLYTLADPENEEKSFSDFKAACKRYRCFLMQYKGFFLHLTASSDIPLNSKFITERILSGHYKNLYRFVNEKKSFGDLKSTKLDSNIYDTLLCHNYTLSLRNISEDNGRIFMNFQILTRLEENDDFTIDEVFAYNRYFNRKRIDLSYDSLLRRVDITNLPDSTYVLNTSCTLGGKHVFYPPSVSEDFAKTSTYQFGDKIVTFNSKNATLTIQHKNKFTLIKDNNTYMLYCNMSDTIDEIFFFNTYGNRRIPLEMVDDAYKIDPDSLPTGDNVLLYRCGNDLYSTVRKNEFSNNILDSQMFDKIITRGKVEIEVE